MSRWQTEFEQHPFQVDWKALLAEAPALTVDDQTVLTSVEELARLKRVVEYLRSAIESLDHELIPKSIWDNFQGQCSACLQQVQQYKSNRNMAHLQAANQHLDNLLSYVKPYLILPEAAIKVLADSAIAYRSQLEQSVKDFLEKSIASASEISTQSRNSKKLLDALLQSKSRIDSLVLELIEGTPENASIQAAVKAVKQTIDEHAAAIVELHKKLLVDLPDAPAISTRLETAKKEILASHTQIQELLITTKEQLSNLGLFHTKIFGAKDPDGKVSGGLEQEIDTRIRQIDKLETDQIQKYQTLFEKIESLLPGATSAGLARAYKELRRSFAAPIRKNTQLFYSAVGLMPVVALVTSTQSFSLWPFSWEIVSYPDVPAILKAMLLKLPFIAPLVWLAVFASIRRSQYERLQQEYAHKEALAKSYESYRKQLEALLVTDAEPLQKELIAKAIEAISFNASATLDGKHHDKMPLEHALETIAGEKGQSLIERLRKLMG